MCGERCQLILSFLRSENYTFVALSINLSHVIRAEIHLLVEIFIETMLLVTVSLFSHPGIFFTVAEQIEESSNESGRH